MRDSHTLAAPVKTKGAMVGLEELLTQKEQVHAILASEGVASSYDVPAFAEVLGAFEAIVRGVSEEDLRMCGREVGGWWGGVPVGMEHVSTALLKAAKLLALQECLLRRAPTSGLTTGPLSGMLVEAWGPEWTQGGEDDFEGMQRFEAQSAAAAALHAAYYGTDPADPLAAPFAPPASRPPRPLAGSKRTASAASGAAATMDSWAELEGAANADAAASALLSMEGAWALDGGFGGGGGGFSPGPHRPEVSREAFISVGVGVQASPVSLLLPAALLVAVQLNFSLYSVLGSLLPRDPGSLASATCCIAAVDSALNAPPLHAHLLPCDAASA